MLMEVSKSLRLIFYYFKFNISAVMEYRISFLIQSFGMILNNASFIFFWWILFNNINIIGGYGFKDVMMLWAITSTSYGLAFVTFGNIPHITSMILKGELDTYLLQPRDPLINIICSKTIISGWGDFLYGIILFFIVRGFDIRGFILFLLFCLTGALMFSAVLVTVHTLSFHIGSAQGIGQLVTEFLITFSIYPEGIFTGITKYILYTAIPVAFMVYIPSEVIGKFDLIRILQVFAMCLLWIILAYIAFYKGLKKYESGNLIINRI